MVIKFLLGHPANRWKLLALRPCDIISQAIQNTGSISPGLVTLEVWRLMAQILYGSEPGELSPEADEEISDLLAEHFDIINTNDVKELIARSSNSTQSFTSIKISSN